MDYTITEHDRNVLRELAKQYAEIAANDVMAIRKRQWKALHDLKPEKPMILFEAIWLDGYLSDYSLRCTNPILRNVESRLMLAIRQFHQMGDDVVVEPYFRVAWWNGTSLTATSKEFGEIKIVERTAEDGGLAYLSNFPIETPDDIKRLQHRTFTIDKEANLKMVSVLQDIFGDILPVKIANFDNFDFDFGNQPFTGNNFIGITWDVFKLIGSDSMMFWMFDHPDAIHELCRFLVDEKKAFYNFLLREKLLDFNTDNQFAGPSCYGYVSDLPEVGTNKEVTLKDLWGWSDSQECQPISPAQFEEFFLPYMAEVANQFGLLYYGCCETVTDRLDRVLKHIPAIRIVSISGWSNQAKAGEILGNRFVYSRKPTPAHVSLDTPAWDLVEKDIQATFEAVKANQCCLEIIFRDVYTKLCTPERAVEWVNRWKRKFDM
jgi:hypothetical protein